jgi:hypothetical protein
VVETCGVETAKLLSADTRLIKDTNVNSDNIDKVPITSFLFITPPLEYGNL